MSDSAFAAGQVHRFRDWVSLYTRPAIGKGSTVYLTPDEARTIAAALIAGADDCEARQFTNSQFRTVEIEPGTMPPPDPRAIYRIVRFFEGDKPNKIRRGLMTLAEARAHCKDPKTRGPGWFDGFEVHPKYKGLA